MKQPMFFDFAVISKRIEGFCPAYESANVFCRQDDKILSFRLMGGILQVNVDKISPVVEMTSQRILTHEES